MDGSWPVLTGDTNQLEYLRYSTLVEPAGYLRRTSPNLQMLSTICIESTEKTVQLFSDLKRNRLSLPSLDQIHLESPLESGTLNRLGELANCLEDLRRDRQWKHIQFTFCGRPFRSPGELRKIARLVEAHHSRIDRLDRLFNTQHLGDHSLRFLKENSELDFLLSDASDIYLLENVEWSEEVIKKLKGIKLLEFRFLFRPGLSIFEMFARTCQSLCVWMLCDQTVTGRLLEMLSKHLLNLESIRIYNCRYETLTPLAKFRNLENLELDFEPPKDELTFLFENSRTLETIDTFGKYTVDLTRTVTGPKMHEIKIGLFQNAKIVKFDTLHAMIDHFYENALFQISEARRRSIRVNNQCRLL